MQHRHNNNSEYHMIKKLDALQPYFLSLLRAVTALTLFSYGTQKILHFPFAEQVPPVGSPAYVAGCFELALGFLLLIGFQTRFAAFVLSGVMASAYFIAHAQKSFFPAQNGGTAAIVFCFVFLYLFFAGGGPLSVDAKIGKK
jgi:putative oxidoreductase